MKGESHILFLFPSLCWNISWASCLWSCMFYFHNICLCLYFYLCSLRSKGLFCLHPIPLDPYSCQINYFLNIIWGIAWRLMQWKQRLRVCPGRILGRHFYLTYFVVNTLNRNQIRAWFSAVFRRFCVMVVRGSSFNKEGVEINFVETWSWDFSSSGFYMVLPRAKSLKKSPMIRQSVDFLEESRGAVILGHGRCTWVEVSITSETEHGEML